jgi:hypothetical protein
MRINKKRFGRNNFECGLILLECGMKNVQTGLILFATMVFSFMALQILSSETLQDSDPAKTDNLKSFFKKTDWMKSYAHSHPSYNSIDKSPSLHYYQY